jgi:hypothetical protein
LNPVEQPNPDGQSIGEGRTRNAFVTLWDPVRNRVLTTATPMPDLDAHPPITGHGMGWTVPITGPDGNVTTRFVGFGGGAMHGIGIPGLDPERPPDTRRAKELLRGLNLVPRGLVKRMERVEKMLGEGAEGGRLVCAVCYDPLLGPVFVPQPVPLPAGEGQDVVMDGQALSADRMDVTSDTKPESSSENPEDSTAKTKQKAKPKHPSLEPNALVALPCTHVFHAVDCLLPWFEQGKTTCPTCRFDVDPHSETLNISRWLGGAARRRRAAAPVANVPSGTAAETPNANTEAIAPVTGAAAPMGAEEDDETDAFALEDEAAPGDLDPNQLFREAIGRAVATALSQALMNQTPPHLQMQLPPENPPTGTHPAASEMDMADGASTTNRSARSLQQAEWARRVHTNVANQMRLEDTGLLNPVIELPGANRDQNGRMFRDDGESSIAATAYSSSENDTDDLEEQVEHGTAPPRGRAQAPSPSPSLALNPEVHGGRVLRSSSRLNANPSASNSERSALNRFREDLMVLDPPTAGPLNSGTSVASSSRPPTPFRHHPYANARPALNFNSRPTPAEPPLPAHNAPGPSGTPAEPIPTGLPNGLPGSLGPDGEMTYQRADGTGRVSISRHSITFNLALPPHEHLAQLGATGANQTPQEQQQQRADAANRIPDFLNTMFTRTGLFGPPPATTTAPGTANANRTERSAPRPRKKWVAPEGTSLRSVIESKERQVGLRCDDVSCVWAPEDEDDEAVDLKIHPDRTYLRKTMDDTDASCVHRYHPECLLVASRVAEAGLDREIDSAEGGAWLEVACPFCRVHGGQEKSEWKLYRDLADHAQ